MVSGILANIDQHSTQYPESPLCKENKQGRVSLYDSTQHSTHDSTH